MGKIVAVAPLPFLGHILRITENGGKKLTDPTLGRRTKF
jgi:hypothetical protein